MTLKLTYSAFVGGEVSDTARGRVDKDFYFKALTLGRNVYVSPQGWVRQREGQQFIANTPSNANARLVAFNFGNPTGTPQVYLFEFSNQRLRIFKNDAVVADYDTGDKTNLTGLTMDVVNAMGFTGDADTLIITHVSIKPLKITRNSDTDWNIDQITFTNLPVFAYNGVTVTQPAQTLTPSGTTGQITLTAGGGTIFSAGSVHQYVVINRGLVYITAFTSATVVTGLVISDLSSSTAAASGKWDYETGYEDVWSNTRGWPSQVVFFHGRLYLGAGPRPQTVWASQVGDFFNMDQGVGDDADGLEFTLDDDGVNLILNLFAGRTLQIFTTGGEFFVTLSTTKPVTPKNIVDLVERASNHGSEAVRPVVVDGATLYVERGGYVIRDYLYNDVEQSYTSKSRSDLADHLIQQPVDIAVRTATREFPFDMVYICNLDGSMAVLNTKAQQDFDAFTSFDTGSVDNPGFYRRVVVLDKAVYFVVERTDKDGNLVRNIEKLNIDHKLDFSTSDTNVTAKTSWTGFNQLYNFEGVKVRGDGFNLDEVAVSNTGTFTSSEAVKNIEAGLFFPPRVVPLPPDADIQGTTLTGDWRQIKWVKMLLQNSDEVIVKRNGKVYRPAFRYFGDNLLDKPVQKTRGWVKVFVDGISQEPQIEITKDTPGDFWMLSMTMGVS